MMPKKLSDEELKLRDAHWLFRDTLEPIWKLKHTRSKRPMYLCKQHFLNWLQKQLGQDSMRIKQISEYSYEDMARAIEICEPLLKKVEGE